MGTPAIALCKWHDYHWDHAAERGTWVHDGDEPEQCRASIGAKVVTVWLPRGAKIRLRLSRFAKSDEPWTREFRHTYGFNRDRQIRFRLIEPPNK